MDPLKVLSNPNRGGGASPPATVCGPHWRGLPDPPAVSTVSDVLMNTRQFSGPALASEGDDLFSGAAW